MSNIDPTTTAGVVGGSAAGLMALAWGLMKFFKVFKSDAAENSVVNLLRQEVERMAVRNKQVLEELGKLQSRVLELTDQLVKLHEENANLKIEVTSLIEEIRSLNEKLLIQKL